MSARARKADPSADWVPIAGLTELARALLGERRDGREVIPVHVRDRVTALAERWAAHGFTAETMRAWIDLDPADAALLNARGISPAALQQHMIAAPPDSTSLWDAVISGALTAEEAVNQLQALGIPESPTVADTPSPTGPPPAVFSHPFAAPAPDNADHRGRSTPRQTPFRA